VQKGHTNSEGEKTPAKNVPIPGKGYASKQGKKSRATEKMRRKGS